MTLLSCRSAPHDHRYYKLLNKVIEGIFATVNTKNSNTNHDIVRIAGCCTWLEMTPNLKFS